MRNEFRILRKNVPCFAKFRVSQNWLKHAKDSFVCFILVLALALAYETKGNCKVERKNTVTLKQIVVC